MHIALYLHNWCGKLWQVSATLCCYYITLSLLCQEVFEIFFVKPRTETIVAASLYGQFFVVEFFASIRNVVTVKSLKNAAILIEQCQHIYERFFIEPFSICHNHSPIIFFSSGVFKYCHSKRSFSSSSISQESMTSA